MKLPFTRCLKYIILIVAGLFLLVFYNTRYVEYGGHHYSYKEYTALIGFNGNSNEIQKLKFSIINNKIIHVFGIDLADRTVDQNILYSLIKTAVFLCWVIAAFVGGMLIFDFILKIPSTQRSSFLPAVIIVILITALVYFIGKIHGEVVLYKNYPSAQNQRAYIRR